MPAQQRLFSLTIDQQLVDLRVMGFSAREALNEPFSIEVDLQGEPLAPALESLLQCPAFLAFGPVGEGLHGIVQAVTERHLESRQYHYHLTLRPLLLSLERQPRLRAFHDLSVPTLLRQLLQEHGLLSPDYRFELARGVYPARPLCLQYGESDLQLFQRLCAEEGIHYHFEHSPHRHTLVLADDRQSFVELTHPLLYQDSPSLNPQEPRIHRLNECRSLAVSDASPPVRQDEANANRVMAAGDGAANQALEPMAGNRTDAAGPIRRDQLGRRQLERLRCAQRHLEGSSNQALLRSGRTVEVQAHPCAAYNRHWLLTEIRHSADSKIASTDSHYRNDFKAIPRDTAFRPVLTSVRPAAFGCLLARVAGSPGEAVGSDLSGRIAVVLESSHQPNAHPPGIWVPWLGGAMQPLPVAGSQVLLEFIDNDLEQPVIIGCLTPSDEHPDPDPPACAPKVRPPRIELDGQPWDQQTPVLNLGNGQALNVSADQTLALNSNGNLILVSAHRIAFQGLQEDPPAQDPEHPPLDKATSDDTDWAGEIRLFAHPHDRERCLSDSAWYIVRMPRPGLEAL